MNLKKLNVAFIAFIVALMAHDTIAARKESKPKSKSNSGGSSSYGGGQRRNEKDGYQNMYDSPKPTSSSYNRQKQQNQNQNQRPSAPGYETNRNNNNQNYGVPQSRPNSGVHPTQYSVPQSRPNQNQQPNQYGQTNPAAYPGQPGHHQTPYNPQQPSYPQQGFPNQGHQQQGYPNQGHQQPGYPNPGYQQPGYSNPGYQQPGFPNQGYQPGRTFGGNQGYNTNFNNNRPGMGKQILTHVAAAAGGALLMHQIGKLSGDRYEERRRDRQQMHNEQNENYNNNNNANNNNNNNGNNNNNQRNNNFKSTPAPLILEPFIPFKVGYDDSESALQSQADIFTSNLVEDVRNPVPNRKAPPINLDESELAERQESAQMSGYLLKHLRPSQSEVFAMDDIDGKSMKGGYGQNSQGYGGSQRPNNNNYNLNYGQSGDMSTPGNEWFSTTIFPMIISQKQEGPKVLPLVIEEMPSMDPYKDMKPQGPNGGCSIFAMSSWILMFVALINHYILV